jgi:hypothetical protein
MSQDREAAGPEDGEDEELAEDEEMAEESSLEHPPPVQE